MTDTNELVLLVCSQDGAENFSEKRYAFRSRPDLQLHLSLEANGGIAVDSNPSEKSAGQISTRGDKWVLDAAGCCHMPCLNRQELIRPTLLRGGDVLTWMETQAFVACHPSGSLPPAHGEAAIGKSGRGSTSIWLDALRETGDRVAEYEIFQRYYPRILDIARLTLHGSKFRTFDEDDVASEALNEFYLGLSSGRFSDLTRREDLWAMLVCMTRRRAIDMLRKASALQRCPEQMRGESVFQFNSIADIHADRGLGKGAAPAVTTMLESADEVEHFLSFLQAYDQSGMLCSVARLRMDGTTNTDIATQLGSSLRAVERAASQIRNLWQQHSGRGELN